jgi:hypothetical protein
MIRRIKNGPLFDKAKSDAVFSNDLACPVTHRGFGCLRRAGARALCWRILNLQEGQRARRRYLRRNGISEPMNDAANFQLKPANDNPWYCLATLYGEQPAQGHRDYDLVVRNRTAWNRWMAVNLTEEERVVLMNSGFATRELAPLTSAEKAELSATFASRIGREKETAPEPEDTVDFTSTYFDRDVIFEGFLFVGIADFTFAAFSGEANFHSARFARRAGFNAVNFSGYADFESTNFLAYTCFNSATFSSDADFEMAKFSTYAEFNEARFFGRAGFKSTKFNSEIDFKSATFSKVVDFINAEFTANTIFANGKFETYVPDFRGAKMHEATEWHGVRWPTAPRGRDAAQLQVYAYERLKQEMERLKKHDDEQSFFRKELRARRGLVSPWSAAWLLNYTYEISSGYGQSMLRPTLWLLAVFVVGVAVFAGSPVFEGMPMTVPRAASLSFVNIFSFLPIKREIMTADMVAGLSSAAQIVGVVQSLLGLVLLFLLGLAMRSRYRMR